MIGHDLKIAWRSLRRNGAYSALNIAGLVVGLTCFLFVALFVRHELSYDRFHAHGGRIYRIGQEVRQAESVSLSANTQVPLGPALARDFPEAERVIRFWRAFRPIVRNDRDSFREEKLYFADPAVFEVFSFPLREGNPRQALIDPGSVVLTESAAARLFGDGPAVGRVLGYEGYPAERRDLIVTGVMTDPPANSQFRFDYLASLAGVDTEADNWGSRKPIWTYVLLAPDADPAVFERKLAGYVDSRLAGSTSEFRLHLEPLTAVHLRSRFPGGFEPGGDMSAISLFSAIGVFILVLACVNFVNLATARSMRRAGEVGLRKVLGAHRGRLIRQFLGEAFLLCAAALLGSLLLLEVLHPWFNAEFGTGLRPRWTSDGGLWLVLAGTVVLVGFLAGSYPAVVLSRFQPAKTLRGRGTGRAGSATLRKGLVVFQFVISIALIAGTLLAHRQLDYIRHKPLGFDKDLLVVLPHNPNEAPLMDALLRDSRVEAVAVSQRVPVSDVNTDGRVVELPHLGEPVRVESYIVDDRFIETYAMIPVAGRGFSRDRATDSDAFVINETAVRAFGWRTAGEAVGTELTWSGSKRGPIIGVVADFHTTSLSKAVEPTVLHMMPGETWWRTHITVRIRAGDLAGTLAFLESAWRRFTPEGVYEAFFIDDSLAELHRADHRFGRIFGSFAALAIVIAGLGLLGLAAYGAEQRTREMGIRKLLGATAAGLVGLLSFEYLKLVAAAAVIAGPLAWFGMKRWLDHFAYRVKPGWTVFAVSALLALIVSLLTVSTQAVRAARADPVDTLRRP